MAARFIFETFADAYNETMRILFNKDGSLWTFLEDYGSGLMRVVLFLFIFLVYFCINAFYSCPCILGSVDVCLGPIAFGVVLLILVVYNWWLLFSTSIVNFPQYHQGKRTNCSPSSSVFLSLAESFYTSSDELHRRSTEFLQNQKTCMDASDGGQQDEHTKYCSTCDIRVPLRCHHCPLCESCVLMKDHHCYIVGSCLGYANQRYFISFLLYGAIASLYAAYWFVQLLHFKLSDYRETENFKLYDYVIPFLIPRVLIYRHVSASIVLYVFLLNSTFCSVWGAIAFFFMQMISVFRGVTMWEFGKTSKHKQDDLNPYQRLRCITGSNTCPLLYLLLPLPASARMEPALRYSLQLAIEQNAERESRDI